jgi:trehalose 6-phosphate synthase/phosphatase
VHDYQLCLVPQMLRDKGLGCPIGFFLHIPFPAADVYRTLPVAEELLRGLLGADLIGFHAYEYVSQFRTAALRVLGMESETSHLQLQSRKVDLEVLPIGIDPVEVIELQRTPEAIREQEEVERAHTGRHIVIGVDRLDYTKGIPLKLLAFEELLRSHPEWCERVVLIQVAAPSRTGVEEYQQLKREVDELVGRINGAFSTPTYTPVIYLNQSVDRTRISGLYRAASVALITPVRDGMNLVALEYVAARKGLGGSLILSEFCGAAHCLPGSRLVNPFNTHQVSQALAEALADGAPHRESFAHMLRFVEENTSMRWAEQFLEKLEKFSGDFTREPKALRVKDPKLRELITKAKRPVVFLDYDGTLRSYVINPKEAVPDARILRLLERLSKVAHVYVVSGRDGATLDSWMGHLNVGLVCEHGLAFKLPGGEWQGRRNVSGTALIRLVKPLFEEFVQRTPGSSIEVKQAAIAWHSRAADPEYSQFQAKALLTRLQDLLKRRPYKVLRGNRVIEVRHEDVTKGSAVALLLELHPRADFIFCAGDDRTDEDMMRALPESLRKRTVTCWVGAPNAHAEYWRESNTALLGELEEVASIWEQSARPKQQRTKVSARTAPTKPTHRAAARRKK